MPFAHTIIFGGHRAAPPDIPWDWGITLAATHVSPLCFSFVLHRCGKRRLPDPQDGYSESRVATGSGLPAPGYKIRTPEPLLFRWFRSFQLPPSRLTGFIAGSLAAVRPGLVRPLPSGPLLSSCPAPSPPFPAAHWYIFGGGCSQRLLGTNQSLALFLTPPPGSLTWSLTVHWYLQGL